MQIKNPASRAKRKFDDNVMNNKNNNGSQPSSFENDEDEKTRIIITLKPTQTLQLITCNKIISYQNW